MLQLKHLSKSFGRETKLLDNVNLAVLPGDILAVTGANGSGKSVLLRIIAGIDKEYSGAISLEDATEENEYINDVLFVVLQNPYLSHANLRIGDVIKICRAAATSWDCEVCDNILSIIGLQSMHSCRHLSQGETVLLQLACGLPRSPRIVLMDEVTSVIDRSNRSVVINILKGYAATGGIVIFNSHVDSDLDALATRVAALDGKTGHLIILV